MNFIIRFFLILLFWIPIDNSFSFESKDFTDTWVDWKKGEIQKILSLKLPKLTYSVEDTDWDAENTARNLTEARKKASSTAEVELKKFLFRKIDTLKLDSDFTLREKIKEDSFFREIFNQIYEIEPIFTTVNFVENRAIAKGTIQFKGKRGILNYVFLSYESENFPEYPPPTLIAEFTSLIVDARHLKLDAALFPEILSEEGNSLYSPYFVSKENAVNHGYVSYMKTPEEAFRSQIAGNKPYFVTALGVTGHYPVNPVIAGEDARKILASTKTKVALKNCRVIILKDK
ncbi:hypothetical protein LEP1GSC132_0419 [Leptospira kirschneri str. 200803703]|uniref:Uncharacterized protein n=1 Tax=Leptospira kirschneri str. 200802841 TaxID=1193047 RepID=A0A828Y1D6_9LEPT|nr:hypothetical protein [Leptospira kirschneri]EKO51545.1 hypothetical protein LEP1GSC131_0372 [Leptospira kirschneri str. 200802841]EMK19270.1 hypothetical protein LEP1GSC042_0282 [Leptospira kirschneri serovar Bim str. PUO 1247]EMN04376.1 hypothetical protein LEP1GSC046_3625 [Leptospira kirschneri serovar Bim str. 1051]EMO66871.1 hypothetical protein LEP1GSC132_0419 [Leptospira kirschneri str. 200803703]